MKNIIKLLIVFFFLIFLSSFSFCNNVDELKIQKFTEEDKNYPENIVAYNLFQDSYNLWKSKKIEDYHFKVNYLAQSVSKGIWEIFVKKGNVVKIITNTGKIIEEKELEKGTPFSNFTMESLFAIASYSYKNSEESFYKFIVVYDTNFGYPREIKKVVQKSDAPKDKGFAYFVIFFEVQ
ncbi:MAG: DUF6174 domain-containing protein [Spirochaetota bacterium]